jgi:hypothetical protein
VNEHRKEEDVVKHMSHNKRVRCVMLSNGKRAWYDISHSDTVTGRVGILGSVLSSGNEHATKKKCTFLITVVV